MLKTVGTLIGTPLITAAWIGGVEVVDVGLVKNHRLQAHLSVSAFHLYTVKPKAFFMPWRDD